MRYSDSEADSWGFVSEKYSRKEVQLLRESMRSLNYHHHGESTVIKVLGLGLFLCVGFLFVVESCFFPST